MQVPDLCVLLAKLDRHFGAVGGRWWVASLATLLGLSVASLPFIRHLGAHSLPVHDSLVQHDCPTSALWGDVNVDGTANIIDAQQIARYSLGLSVVRLAAMEYAGDATDDGSVNIIDAQQIARFSVALSAAPRLGSGFALPPSPGTIVIGPEDPALMVGDSLELAATAFDVLGRAMGGCAPLTWATDDTSSLRVSATGVIHAIGAGYPLVNVQSGLTSSAVPVAVLTSAASVGVVTASDTTKVSAPSGAAIIVPAGSMPAGTRIRLADAGEDHAAGSHQIGGAIALSISAPAPVSLRALPEAFPEPGSITSSLAFPVAMSPDALRAAGLSVVFRIPRSGSPPSILYNRSVTVNPLLEPNMSLVSVPLSGMPASTVLASLRLDTAVDPNCAVANQFEDPDHAGNPSQAVDPARVPLILIHGWQFTKEKCADFQNWNPTGSGGTWGVLYPKLTAPGNFLERYQVWAMRYPTNRPIGDAVAYLKDQIQARFGNRDVVIVAHSMGGVVAAKYLSDPPAKHVSQLITLATPFQGSILADVIARRDGVSSFCSSTLGLLSGLAFGLTVPLPFTEGVADLSPNSVIYETIAAAHANWWGKTTVYRGDVSSSTKLIEPLAWGRCVIGGSGDTSDGVVSSTSAEDPAWGAPAFHFTFSGLNHLDMASSAQSTDEVLTRLKELPAMALTSNHAEFAYSPGSNSPLDQRLGVQNRGLGTVTGLVTAVAYESGQPAGWLSAGLSAAEAPAVLSLQVAPATLVAGTYKATVTVSSGAPGVTNSPQGVDVTLTVQGPIPFTQVSGGFNHTCAINSNGAAFCWGGNMYGALGDSTTVDRLRPRAVAAALTFQTIVAGERRTCAATVGNAGFCWGLNIVPEPGTFFNSSPLRVPGSVPFLHVTAGQFHSCGLTVIGSAYCWGLGTKGELGNGELESSRAPVAVSGTHTFVQIVSNAVASWEVDNFTCGVTTSGRAFCWGGNSGGVLGNGTVDGSAIPAQVSGTVEFKSIAMGVSHTCGLDLIGAAFCWGHNESGQLGNGVDLTSNAVPTSEASPVAVVGGRTFQKIFAGGRVTCGLTGAGKAYCWGTNGNGEIGDRTTIARSVPTEVLGNRLFTTLGIGVAHACGVATDGDTYCWGANYSGQLGDGTTVNRLEPTKVTPAAP